jgi:hypothetical protein
VVGKGWTKTTELQVGDLLVSHDGQTTPVADILDTGIWETVYNFRVADYHTYFVHCNERRLSVWAHNSCIVDAKLDRLNPNRIRTAFAQIQPLT